MADFPEGARSVSDFTSVHSAFLRFVPKECKRGIDQYVLKIKATSTFTDFEFKEPRGVAHHLLEPKITPSAVAGDLELAEVVVQARPFLKFLKKVLEHKPVLSGVRDLVDNMLGYLGLQVFQMNSDRCSLERTRPLEFKYGPKSIDCVPDFVYVEDVSQSIMIVIYEDKHRGNCATPAFRRNGHGSAAKFHMVFTGTRYSWREVYFR